MFFLKNLLQNLVEKLVPDPFTNNHNWAYLKLRCRPLAFTSYRAFFKNKKMSETSLRASFSGWFFKKFFSCYILLTDWLYSINCVWLALLLEILGYMCLVIILYVIKFEINLSFLIKPVSYMTRKARAKI